MKSEWHILTVTRGGTVSLLKNLTEDVARLTMQRLRRPLDGGDPWSNYRIIEKLKMENSPGVGIHRSYSYSSQPGDLKQIECFGPEGAELEVWPKPSDYEERLERARELVGVHGDVRALSIMNGWVSADQSAQT